MNIEKLTEASYFGVASATATISGISLISVSASNFRSDAPHQILLTKIGLSGIAVGIVLGLMTAYFAVNAYLSTSKD